MFGAGELYAALNVASIIAVVDSYGSDPAIWIDELVPIDFDGRKSINCYMTAPHDARQDVEFYNYSASCRAETANESRMIAKAVIDEINRKNYTGYQLTCRLLQTIPPVDKTDTYNTPVEIVVKKDKNL